MRQKDAADDLWQGNHKRRQDMSLVIGTISLAGKELTVAALKNYKPTSPLSVCLLERVLPIQNSN